MIVGCLRHATEGSVLRVSSSLIEDLVRQCENVVLPCPPNELPELPSLAVALGAVPDPRRRKGQRYRLAFLLALAVVAVLGGAKSLAAIAQWARDADEATLTALGAPACRRPAATTIGRAFERVAPDALDDACFGWINALLTDAQPDTTKTIGLAVDGKPVRGAKNAGGKAPHLVAAVRQTSPPCSPPSTNSTGRPSRSATPTRKSHTAATSSAPSRSAPRPRASGSRTPPRSS